MIPGIGTIVNGVGVLFVGILSRVIFKKELKDFEDNLLPLGLLVLALGLRESLKSPDYVRLINFEVSGFIFTLFAVIIGAVIGNFLKIEEKIKNFGDYLYSKFEKSDPDQSKFIESYLTTTLIVVTVYSGVSILIYQGFFTLCALLINTNIDQIVSDSIAGIGGVLLIGVGINLLGLKKIPVGNYMLSLFVPFVLTL